jgi:hypothetical protein
VCLCICSWTEKSGYIASDGRMMRQPATPVAVGHAPWTIAAEDVFKCHRLAPSLVAGIVGWAHVADELLASLQAELTTYDEQIVTGHMGRLIQKHPGAALQAVLMGVRDGRVHAAMWGDFDPSRSFTPTHPLKRPKVLCIGNTDVAGEASAMVRRGSPLNTVFETLAQKYDQINANVRVEEIYGD